ncbi:MAG TPA: YbgC/FadM family acyl-CoA thioesterase [Aquabacterium sp.]|uniref:YbgC/FadM family acyl-CoA thioesterase n=1 Tax=Aquabacterium sp. TaxID=1872578 RepID=UPI002E33AA07|nr:YbgC/FadM family acyl-CoA thioesterase [Aquabacterium sp.]HEX5374012.1 YbgC/FadM family acyl-CoA thioesterase [Aquabacterium sp.]
MGAPAEGPDPRAEHFRWPVRVYWEDTDAGGIVFYANYLKFFERARTEWLRTFFHQGQEAMRLAGHGMFVVTETSVRYLRPARLDDEIIVTVRLSEIGRASFGVVQQAWRGATLLAEGSIRIGWVQSRGDEGLRPARLPADFVAGLPAVLDGAQSTHNRA